MDTLVASESAFGAGAVAETARRDVEECGAYVMWWDGEYEGQCELPAGHDGHHFDGLSCFAGDYTSAEEVYGCEIHAHA